MGCCQLWPDVTPARAGVPVQQEFHPPVRARAAVGLSRQALALPWGLPGCSPAGSTWCCVQSQLPPCAKWSQATAPCPPDPVPTYWWGQNGSTAQTLPWHPPRTQFAHGQLPFGSLAWGGEGLAVCASSRKGSALPRPFQPAPCPLQRDGASPNTNNTEELTRDIKKAETERLLFVGPTPCLLADVGQGGCTHSWDSRGSLRSAKTPGLQGCSWQDRALLPSQRHTAAG